MAVTPGRRMVLAGAVMLGTVTMPSTDVRACSVIDIGPVASPVNTHLDDGLEAPTPPVPTRVEVERGKDDGSGDCNYGSVMLGFSPSTDDRTPAEWLGYRVLLVDGALPEGLRFDDGTGRAMLRNWNGGFLARWTDGLRGSQDAVDFTVVITAVDAAGNESDPSPRVHVHDAGSGEGGCSIVASVESEATQVDVLLGVGVLTIARRVRSRRGEHRSRGAGGP